MDAFALLGYAVWIAATLYAVMAGRGDCCRPVAWQSRIAFSTFAAMIACFLGATPLVVVFFGGGLICMFAPKTRPGERLL